MNVGERIKKLRKVLDLTQQEFAERIGIKRNTIATYEIGRSEPIDAVISLICREFNVSETWLRTGDGEMFVEPSEFSLDDLAKQCNANEFDLKIVKKYFELPVNIRRMLVDHFKSVFVEENPSISDTSGQGRTGEQKMPIPVSGDGQDELEELVRKHKKNLTDNQQQQILEMMQAMITSQKEPLPASAQRTVDEKSPKTERPGQS